MSGLPDEAVEAMRRGVAWVMHPGSGDHYLDCASCHRAVDTVIAALPAGFWYSNGQGNVGEPPVQVVAAAIADSLARHGMGVSRHMPGDERIDFYDSIARHVIAALSATDTESGDGD